MDKCIHIVGIAGVGMSALAQAALWCGYTVSGSDRYLDQGTQVAVLEKLARCGIQLYPQDGSGISSQTTCVVVSTAIEADNPDLATAASYAVPVMHRSKLLAELVGAHTCVAIAGTSGKTTVTGMTGWILEAAGHDPFVVNGGHVQGWKDEEKIGNVRAGKSGLWLIEADESDRSFLNYTPHMATITNISRDHFSLDESTQLFAAFAVKVATKIICGAGVRERLISCDAGLAEKLIEPYCTYLSGTENGFIWDGQTYRIPVLGRHNASNAFMAAILAAELGVTRAQIQKALLTFPGIERRLQVVGRFHEVTVIDDYAHNPAKIFASWNAVKAAYGQVTGVWRPHGFGPLQAMHDELINIFKDIMDPSDHLYVLPVYYAGGTAARAVTSEEFVKALVSAGVSAFYVPDYLQLKASLEDNAQPGSAILCMGARDPELPRFTRQLCHIEEKLQEKPR